MNKEEEREYWARLVRETQRASGLTLEALADRLGITPREVAYWKSGERRPTGIVAVRFFELRRDCILGTVVHVQALVS